MYVAYEIDGFDLYAMTYPMAASTVTSPPASTCGGPTIGCARECSLLAGADAQADVVVAGD